MIISDESSQRTSDAGQKQTLIIVLGASSDGSAQPRPGKFGHRCEGDAAQGET